MRSARSRISLINTGVFLIIVALGLWFAYTNDLIKLDSDEIKILFVAAVSAVVVAIHLFVCFLESRKG